LFDFVPLKKNFGAAGALNAMTLSEPKKSFGAPRALGNSVMLVGGGIVSTLAILAASAFHPAPPSEIAKAAGIKAGTHDVTLSPGAPQWQSIHVGTAQMASHVGTDSHSYFRRRRQVKMRKEVRDAVNVVQRDFRLL